MVEFAKRINATLVAEGIETPAELSAIAGLGMSAGQGYLLGRPSVQPRDWATWVHQNRITGPDGMPSPEDACPFPSRTASAEATEDAVADPLIKEAQGFPQEPPSTGSFIKSGSTVKERPLKTPAPRARIVSQHTRPPATRRVRVCGTREGSSLCWTRRSSGIWRSRLAVPGSHPILPGTTQCCGASGRVPSWGRGSWGPREGPRCGDQSNWNGRMTCTVPPAVNASPESAIKPYNAPGKFSSQTASLTNDPSDQGLDPKPILAT